MKDKLIELIQESVGGCARNWAEVIADHLLAEGVIVPPCKPNDDLYWIDSDNNEIKCAKADIKAVCYYGDGKFRIICKGESSPEDLGTKWAMLSRKEAEKALERMANNG